MWICNYLTLDWIFFELLALIFFAIEAFIVIEIILKFSGKKINNLFIIICQSNLFTFAKATCGSTIVLIG